MALSGLRGCGENRYVGVQNYLEFILTANCEVTIKPVDAILCNVRLQWTFAEFYAAGGTTSFVDRVSAVLGIHASQIKVVATYEGSVVIEFLIEADDENDTDDGRELRAIERALNEMIRNQNSAFGARVLSASTDGEAIIEDVTYNPTVNEFQSSQQATTTTPIVKPQVTVVIKSETVTVTEEEKTIDETTAATASLLVILLVLVLVCVCCFGMGALCLCVMKSTPASQKEMPKAQQQMAGSAGVDQQSEVDMNPQFHPNQDFDIDIFSNKKRVFKMNDDYLAQNA